MNMIKLIFQKITKEKSNIRYHFKLIYVLSAKLCKAARKFFVDERDFPCILFV
jgi:hypothetical protein